MSYERETCEEIYEDKRDIETCTEILNTHDYVPSEIQDVRGGEQKLHHWATCRNAEQIKEEGKLRTGVADMISLTANPGKLHIVSEEFSRNCRFSFNLKDLAKDKPHREVVFGKHPKLVPVYYKLKGEDVPDEVMSFYHRRGIHPPKLNQLINPGEGFSEETWNITSPGERPPNYSYESEWKSLTDIGLGEINYRFEEK